MTGFDFEEVTTTEPEKSLLRPIKKSGGRNSNGRITSRHRGGGHKRRYRLIDFRRIKDGIPGKIATVEYDPNRSARIALLVYADGEKRYIIAPEGLKAGDNVLSGVDAPPSVGNCLPMKVIPIGMKTHAIEMRPGKGAALCRSAGSSAT